MDIRDLDDETKRLMSQPLNFDLCAALGLPPATPEQLQEAYRMAKRRGTDD